MALSLSLHPKLRVTLLRSSFRSFFQYRSALLTLQCSFGRIITQWGSPLPLRPPLLLLLVRSFVLKEVLKPRWPWVLTKLGRRTKKTWLCRLCPSRALRSKLKVTFYRTALLFSGLCVAWVVSLDLRRNLWEGSTLTWIICIFDISCPLIFS